MPELNDLVERAQSGDLDAYDTIVKRFQDMAVGYCFSQLGDFHLAEDVAQEAFLGAYGNLSQLRSSAAFVTWFRQILFRQCQQFWRQKRMDTIAIDSVGELISDAPNPEEIAERSEMRNEIINLIKTLPEEEGQALTLFYMSEYSQAEVANFLGVSINTVKNRLRFGRRKMKERMLDMAKETLREQAPSNDDEFANVVSLCNAAQAGDVKRVEHLLAQDPKLAVQPISQNGQLAIQFAAREGHADLVGILLRAGADPLRGAYPNRKATNALAFARDRGHLDVVKVIEDYLEAHPAHEPEYGPIDDLITAIKSSDIDAVMILLKDDASLATHPQRPLKDAAIQGHVDIVRLLLDAGADPDEPYDMDLGDEGIYVNKGVPLWEAAHHNHYEVCALLLERGADPNAYVFASGPAAEKAMENNNDDILKLIYRYGGVGFADAAALCGQIAVPAEVMNLQPEKAPRMLWGAALSGNVDLARLCFKYDMQSTNWYQLLIQPLRGRRSRTQWLYADGKQDEWKNKIEIFRLMLENGADANIHESKNIHLLHRLIGEGTNWSDEEKIPFVELLLDFGADIDVRDDELKSTPLAHAARYGHFHTVKFLLERGARTNLPDDEDWATPLAWAEKMGHNEIANVLREHGAES